MNIDKFWNDVAHQREDEIRKYFNSKAYIKWHNTNELFNVEEFIVANCEYPGKWDYKIKRCEIINNLVITVTNIFSVDKSLSFHVVSFIELKDDKIIALDEYWGTDGKAPNWRIEKNLGKCIE